MAKSEIKLSDFELEVMQVLWQMREATTPELHTAIQTTRDVAYSTVRTIVDRLEQKGAIKRHAKQGRAISFKPLLKQSRMSKSLVKGFVTKLFAGESRSLFSQLLEDESLDDEDIRYLEALIARKKRAMRDKS